MIDKLIGPVTSLLDKFIEDKDQKAKLAHEVATMAEKHALELSRAQLDVNKAEAQHRSIFVSGWRPFTGWSCAAALFYHFLLQPLLVFVFSLLGYQFQLPEFDMSSLMTILLGMLGLGGLRTYEKQKNLTK